MGIRLTSVAALFVTVGVILVVILSGPSWLFTNVQAQNLRYSQEAETPGGNAITRENAQPGTSNWQIPGGKEASIEIQAYASATSVSAGQSQTFYVSTQQENIYYSLGIYRLGWYGGQGGRLMLWKDGLRGQVQGYYNQTIRKLENCATCRINRDTGLIEANWHPSYTVTVPPDWTTGVYLAKFTNAKGLQTYVPFDVRGNFHSLYIAVTSDTTYEAYNIWGGYSLYDAADTIHSGEQANEPKGVKVSFDRPYADQQGSSLVLTFEANAIHWMERQGYDLSYISSVDLHEHPAQLLNHRAYLSLGHDEYWSKEMRDGIENARDSGVGLAFLGADDGYWQVRFEPDSSGTLDRTIVCYKVQTGLDNLSQDPFYGKDNSRLTTQWRDPILNRPENALIGVMFSGLAGWQAGFPWQLSPRAHSQFLDGTGLVSKKKYGCFFVGYEWDRTFANGASPAGLQILGNSPVTNADNLPDASNTTYYIAPSGAMVFATGSINWTTALDDYRLNTHLVCPQQTTAVPGMQKLMANVMNALIIHHHTL